MPIEISQKEPDSCGKSHVERFVLFVSQFMSKPREIRSTLTSPNRHGVFRPLRANQRADAGQLPGKTLGPPCFLSRQKMHVRRPQLARLRRLSPVNQDAQNCFIPRSHLLFFSYSCSPVAPNIHHQRRIYAYSILLWMPVQRIPADCPL